MQKRLKVLVLGSTTSKEYAIIRSLGKAGHTVYATCEGADPSPFAHSRYIFAKLDFPPKTDSEKWLLRLEAVLQSHDFDAIIPTDDYAIINLFAGGRHLVENQAFILPDKASWDVTYYKDQTFDVARRLGIPCPNFITVGAYHEHVIENLDLRFPVIVKPLSSKVQCGQNLIWAKHAYAETREMLKRELKALLALGPAVVQEFCPGIGMGQGLIMDRGKTVAAFQYERVHEPPKGGASSYRRSVPIDRRVLSYSERILQELKWTGPVMVEYRYDKATEAINLVEINGRFWGSLPLPIAAGMDLPRILLDYRTNPSSQAPCEYKAGIFCRNLEKDLNWLVDNFKAPPKHPLFIRVPLKTLLMEPFRLLSGKEHFDEIKLDDPQPGLLVLKRILRQFYRRVAARGAKSGR